ncbi:MAG TPA: hypothetical protein VM282_21660 [Acidimicrobiales bacterium]|nr:hypothetical protein [Acidimicrobiales bacterium]
MSCAAGGSIRLTGDFDQHRAVHDGLLVSIGDVLKCRLDTTELEVRVLRDFYVAHH